MKQLLLLNGPNLNLLGAREPDIYGHYTLASIEDALVQKALSHDLACACFQSNHEGELVDRIQQARTNTHGIIINAGAFTHTSVAIRDALIAVDIPFVEVHISNIYQRESFRHHSYLSDKSVGVIAGLGIYGYEAAMVFLAQYLT